MVKLELRHYKEGKIISKWVPAILSIEEIVGYFYDFDYYFRKCDRINIRIIDTTNQEKLGDFL